jgi:molybdopterin-guanine dinucleotide biosynthesis protein A
MPPASPSAEPRVTVIIVAGGEASRLPRKLELPVLGIPMIVRVRQALATVGACIVAARVPFARSIAESLDARVVLDDRPGEGPLAALASAVSFVETPYFFAAAGDMPGLDASFVARIVSAAADAAWPDAVVPMWPDGTMEPLAALYAAAPWSAAAAEALRAGRRNVTAALQGLRVVRYPLGTGDEATLANVNTPEDYRRALARVAPDAR